MSLRGRVTVLLVLGTLSPLLSCASEPQPTPPPVATSPPPTPRRVCVDPASSDECCPRGWLPLRDGGCAPRVEACRDPSRAVVGACDTALDRTDPVAAFWAWGTAPTGPAWFAPWTCPTGWSSLPDGSCAPAANLSCAADEPPLPDGTCTPVGVARCPSTEFPEVPADAMGARVVYVRSGASNDAEGTREAPIGDLAGAIERAGEDGVVLVAPGVYRLSVELTGRRRVIGACAARVTLQSASDDPVYGVFRTEGRDAFLRVEGVTIDTGYHHLFALHGSRIVGRGLVLRGVHSIAEEARGNIDIEGLRAELHPRPAYPDGGGEAFVATAGSFTLRDAHIHGGQGIFGTGSAGTVAWLENISARSFRFGIASRDAAVRIRNVSLDGVGAPVLYAARGRQDVDGLFVSHAFRAEIPQSGTIQFVEGTEADLHHVRIEHDRASAIRGGSAGMHLNLRDVAIVGQDDHAGTCIEVEQGGALDAARLRLESCGGDAIATYALANATLEDVYVRDPRVNKHSDVGVGITHVFGGTTIARRVRVEGAVRFGIATQSFPPAVIERIPWDQFWPPGQQLVDHPTRLELEDVAVARSNPSLMSGPVGVAAAAGTEVTAHRLAVVDQHALGIASVDDGFNREILLGGLSRTLALNPATRAVLKLLLGPNLDAPSTMRVDGLYVSRTAPWNLLVDFQNPTAVPGYRASWAAYAAPGCSLTLRDATLDAEGISDRAVVAGGSVSLDRAVITRFQACALATMSTVPEAQITTRDTSLRANGGDSVCRESSLPRVRLPLSSE